MLALHKWPLELIGKQAARACVCAGGAEGNIGNHIVLRIFLICILYVFVHVFGVFHFLFVVLDQIWLYLT